MKNHQKVGTSHLQRAMDEFGLNKSELSAALGMSNGFVSTCMSANEAPAWSQLAVECLFRRQGKHKGEVTLIIKVPGSKKEAVTSFLDALGIAASVV